MGKSLKGKELGAGIYQRKDGLYYGRFKNRFGKLQTIYDNSYNGLRKKLAQAKTDDANEVNVISSNMTLDEWFEKWKSVCKCNCRDSTLQTYTNHYKRVAEKLGWRKLSQLNLIIIQDAINSLETDNQRKNSKKILVDMLNKAVASDLITKNPAILVNTTITKEKKKEKVILTEQDIKTFLLEAKDCRYYNAFVLALETGLRVGEIMGLTWDDIHEDYLEVNKTLVYFYNNGKYEFEFHDPKTFHSSRKIPLTQVAKEALEDQKSRYGTGIAKGYGRLVFQTKNNKPTQQFILQQAIAYVSKSHEPFSFHTFRHTFATRCVEKGMNPKTLQRILGHAQLQMTMDLYCHVTDDKLFDEMKQVEVRNHKMSQ